MIASRICERLWPVVGIESNWAYTTGLKGRPVQSSTAAELQAWRSVIGKNMVYFQKAPGITSPNELTLETWLRLNFGICAWSFCLVRKFCMFFGNPPSVRGRKHKDRFRFVDSALGLHWACGVPGGEQQKRVGSDEVIDKTRQKLPPGP